MEFEDIKLVQLLSAAWFKNMILSKIKHHVFKTNPHVRQKWSTEFLLVRAKRKVCSCILLGCYVNGRGIRLFDWNQCCSHLGGRCFVIISQTYILWKRNHPSPPITNCSSPTNKNFIRPPADKRVYTVPGGRDKLCRKTMKKLNNII